jgi:hypothetical protein
LSIPPKNKKNFEQRKTQVEKQKEKEVVARGITIEFNLSLIVKNKTKNNIDRMLKRKKETIM